MPPTRRDCPDGRTLEATFERAWLKPGAFDPRRDAATSSPGWSRQDETIAAHLSTCALCRRELATWRMTARPSRSMRATGQGLDAQTQLGRFTILSTLGGDEFGNSYEAYDSRLQRVVELKLVRADDSTVAEVWFEHARRVAQLHHPHVATTYEVDTHGPWRCMSMERVSPTSLREWRTKAAPERSKVYTAFHQAALGLTYAHHQGVAHGNFSEDHAYVAVAAGSLLVCVSDFRPPMFESADGLALDIFVDRYCFAASLWAALYGVLPYRGQSIDAVRYDLQRSLFVPKSATALDQALRDCLSTSDPEVMTTAFTRLMSALSDSQAVTQNSITARRVWSATAVVAGIASLVGAWVWSSRPPACRVVAIDEVWPTAVIADVAADLKRSGPAWLVGAAQRAQSRHRSIFAAARAQACKEGDFATELQVTACLRRAAREFALRWELHDRAWPNELVQVVDWADMPSPLQCRHEFGRDLERFRGALGARNELAAAWLGVAKTQLRSRDGAGASDTFRKISELYQGSIMPAWVIVNQEWLQMASEMGLLGGVETGNLGEETEHGDTLEVWKQRAQSAEIAREDEIALQAWTALANAALSKGELSSAHQALEQGKFAAARIRELSPDLVWLWHKAYAELLVRRGRPSQGVARLEEALADPVLSHAVVGRIVYAQFLLRLGRDAEAARAYLAAAQQWQQMMGSPTPTTLRWQAEAMLAAFGAGLPEEALTVSGQLSLVSRPEIVAAVTIANDARGLLAGESIHGASALQHAAALLSSSEPPEANSVATWALAVALAANTRPASNGEPVAWPTATPPWLASDIARAQLAAAPWLDAWLGYVTKPGRGALDAWVAAVERAPTNLRATTAFALALEQLVGAAGVFAAPGRPGSLDAAGADALVRRLDRVLAEVIADRVLAGSSAGVTAILQQQRIELGAAERSLRDDMATQVRKHWEINGFWESRRQRAARP